MAEFDTSIYRSAGGAFTPQISSPIATAAKLSQLRQLQDQQAMGQLQRQQVERKLRREGELAGLYQEAGGDQNKLVTLLGQRGFFPEMQAIQKEGVASQKTQAESGKLQMETLLKKMQVSRDALAGVNGDADMPAYKEMVAQIWGPDVAARTPEKFDPNWKNSVMMTSEQHFQALQNQMQRDVTMRGQNMTADTARRGQDVTQRGQDMTMETGSLDRSQRQSESQSRLAAESLRANRTNTQQGVELGIKLRKEFDDLAEVKKYKEIVPTIDAAREALKRDTPQADINLIYATAKIFDPTSVVREGEYATVSNSQSPQERMKGMLNYLANGGKLTAKTRQQLLDEIQGRADAAESAYETARNSYTGMVERAGTDPRDVFQDVGNFRAVRVDGKTLSARRAPDGKWYVQRDGKYFRVE